MHLHAYVWYRDVNKDTYLHSYTKQHIYNRHIQLYIDSYKNVQVQMQKILTYCIYILYINLMYIYIYIYIKNQRK